MGKQICFTMNESLLEQVDEIARGLKRSRSRTVEDLLEMAFNYGAMVENEHLTLRSEEMESLQERVKWLEGIVEALAKKAAEP